VPLRLCSPWRLTASLGIAFTAWALQAKIGLLLDNAYLKLMGVRPPQAISLLMTAVEAGLLGLLVGFIVRSPLTGAFAALSILAGGHLAGTPWPPIVAAALSGGILAVLASLSGGPLDALRSLRRRQGGLPLALAATSALAAAVLGVPCGPYWAVGALATAIEAYLLDYPESLLAALLAGLGWLGAFTGAVAASLKAVPAPSCGGVEMRVDSILSRAPASRIIAGPHGLWASWGFECARGEGTVVPEGDKGSVLVAYGPNARLVAGLTASKLQGTLVVCASCNIEYWRGLGFSEAHFRVGGEPPKIEPPALLVVESERPWDYVLTAVASIASVGAYEAIVIDRADLVRGAKVLEAVVEEALEASRLVVLVEPEPSRGPLVPRVAEARLSIAIAGPVPQRYASELLPLGSAQAVEAVYDALRRGYAVFYPTCGGGVVAAKLASAAIIEHK